MADKTGLWHTTSVQQAQARQQTYQTTSVAGYKRSFDQEQKTSLHTLSTTVVQRPQFRAASSLPKQPPRLSASRIDHVDVNNTACQRPTEYSQRKVISATPTSTVDPLLSLSHPKYALPRLLVTNFENLGIKSIYPWQKQCLLGPNLLSGEKNLVYSAPTGGGKSLVADVLMLKQVLANRDAKGLLVLPYVALVQEKVRWFRNLVQNLSMSAILGPRPEQEAKFWRRRADDDAVRVVGFVGGSKITHTWSDFDIGVCTIEKANALVNTAITDGSIGQLKVVVLDELHMIDDGYRGYLLELLATKVMCLNESVQIIGMSATLTNIELLSKWLNSHSYETQYRPIPIEEHLVHEGKVYPFLSTTHFLRTATQLHNSTMPSREPGLPPQPVRVISDSEHKEFKDPVLNAVVALTNETVRSGFGALVFAGSRAACESDALIISRVMPTANEIAPSVLDKRTDLLGELRSLPTGLDKVLEQTILAGVAYHHAGLTTEERDLIANAYDSGVLKVCVATCSLAAGINLPARRVILHHARMGRDLVGPSMLRQMRGRAGRKGKDEVGETYLCCRQSDLEDVVELMHADLPQISSCLVTDQRRIRRALLEVIAVRLATSRESIDDYITRTMLYHSEKSDSIWPKVEEALSELESMAFIAADGSSGYEATKLGKAVVASALDPEDGVFIHKELERALKAFVMDGDMHVLYTFTPVHDFMTNINWRTFWNEMEGLDESGMRVLTMLGLKPTVISKMQSGGTLKESTPEEKEIARIYHRFYLALQLRDLCNEVPIHRVAQKYDMPRGSVQQLAQTCQGFAAGMIKFCQHMDWGGMAAVLEHFSDRLRAGAKDDLLALAKLPFVKSRTARVFWENGFKSVAIIANAHAEELVPVLMQAQPNKIRLGTKDESKFKEKLLVKAKVITDAANKLWQAEMQLELDEE